MSTDATVLKLPERKTIKWDDLPDTVKEALHEQYIRHIRAEFDCMEHEVVATFLELPETQQELTNYRERCWHDWLCNGEGDFYGWLEEKDIEL